MTIYTRLERDEIVRLTAQYPIGVLEDIEDMTGGQANSSFKLTASTGNYVLSICDEKTAGEVEHLARVLRYLAENGFRTTRVVSTTEGAMVSNHRGKPVLLKHYLEGSVTKNMTAAMARLVGRELALLHQVTPPHGLPPRFAYGLESFDEVITSRLDNDYRTWLREKMAYLTQAISPDLPRCLIHGDVFYDNALFKGKKLAALIDFEEACHYYRTFDLGMCAAGSCTTGGLLDVNKTRALVDGYLEIGNLASREKKALQAFVIYGATATSFWRFRQYNLLLPGHENSKTYRQMNLIADQVHDMPVDDFFNTMFSSKL
jgi:homoserine kinase type II